jgi:hypothetical protein
VVMRPIPIRIGLKIDLKMDGYGKAGINIV